MNKDYDGISKIYDFYAYDSFGKDVVISIRAIDEDEAWDNYEKSYSGYVDQVIVRELKK